MLGEALGRKVVKKFSGAWTFLSRAMDKKTMIKVN